MFHENAETFNPRSRSFREQKRKEEYVALCIVGTVGRVPRAFGDDVGAHPCRVVMTTGKPTDAPKVFNRGVHSPNGIYVLHAHVFLESEHHFNRVKEYVLGKNPGEEMLFGWTDQEPWVYELLVGDAVLALGFEAFDGAERDRRIAAAARRRY